jgi:hypothetical protein
MLVCFCFLISYVTMKMLTFNSTQPHCNKNPIYVFPENELSGLSPNFHIHAIYMYIFPGSVHLFFLQQNRQTDHRNKLIAHWQMNVWMGKLGPRPCNSFSGNVYFEFSVLCLCSAASIQIDYKMYVEPQSISVAHDLKCSDQREGKGFRSSPKH